MVAAALDNGIAAATAGFSPPLLVALLLVPGIVVLLCLDFWRLCRRDPDARDASSTNGRHSVLVGNASFVWKKGPDKKTPSPAAAAADVTSITAAVDDPSGRAPGGDGGGEAAPAAQPGSTAVPVPDIAAELPYLLPADAAAADDASLGGSPACRRPLKERGDEDDYQSPGGDLPYHAPADQLRNSETAEEEPYYAVPVHRTSQPAPLPPPRRRQARVS